MENLRDRAIEKFENLAEGVYKAKAHRNLQNALSSLSPDQIDIVRRCIVESIDSGIHDFLFAIQENLDFENDIQIKVEGTNIAELSDGLHGELFTEDGWQAKYSKFGEAPDES